MNPLKTGFAVALKGSDRLVVGRDAFGADGKPSAKLVSLVRGRIDAAMKTKAPSGAKTAIGGWHNPDDGKIEVNVTAVFPKTHRESAISFAKLNDQIAIFSIHEGQTIMTGGTGGDRTTS